ncbi:MAG: hypothetical protein WC442_05600, partial [Candidatus Omnitrophota bacterium]
MIKLFKICGLFFCFLFIFFQLSFAEDITITTYYPSPFGNYRELRAARIAIGDNYIDGTAFTWENVNGDGGEVDFQADLVVEGNSGFGTANPASRVEVVGSAANVSALHVNLGDISLRGGNMGNCGIRFFDRTDTNHRIYYSGATNSLHFDSYAQMYFNQGFYTPGNVGIGMTTPTGKLIIRGAGTTNGLTLQTQNSSGTQMVTILDNGNVGLGTTAPVSKLDVAGAANDSALHITQGDLTLNGGNTVPWTRGSKIRFFSRNDTNHAIYYAGSTNSLHFDSYAQMYFNQGFYTPGNVGIGITTPRSMLDVAGGVRANKGNTWGNDSSNVGFSFEQDGDTGMFAVGGNSVMLSDLIFKIDTAERMRITTGGNIGIGTSAPQGTLDVNGLVYANQFWVRGTSIHYPDYVFEPTYKLESIDEHSEYMWEHKHLKAIPEVMKDKSGNIEMELSG